MHALTHSVVKSFIFIFYISNQTAACYLPPRVAVSNDQVRMGGGMSLAKPRALLKRGIDYIKK